MSYLGTTYQLGSAEGPHFRNIRVVPNSDGTMSDKTRGYGIAVLASGAAFGIVVLLTRILPFEPFLLFTIPVVLTARYVGRGPTALTVALSVVAIEGTLVWNGHVAHTHAGVWLHAAIFAILASGIG